MRILSLLLVCSILAETSLCQPMLCDSMGDAAIQGVQNGSIVSGMFKTGLPVIMFLPEKVYTSLSAMWPDIKDVLTGSLEPDSLDNKDMTVVLAASLTGKAQVLLSNSTASGSNTDFLSDEPLDPLISKYAEMISIDPVDINNYPLYHFIDEWYGISYRWGGEDNTGIDCSAFSQKLYSKVYGVELLRTARQQHRNCERIRHAGDATEGDLVFFRINHLRISHVGIYLANGYFVHASRSQGVVISNLNSKYWHRRFAGCGRIEREDKAALESDMQ